MRNYILLLLLFFTASAHAADSVLVKRAIRTVYMFDTTDYYEGRKAKDARWDDSLITESVVNLAKQKRINLYAAVDTQGVFAVPLSKEEICEEIKPQIDSVDADDPITAQRYIKVLIREFRFETIQHYKLMEEWRYNVKNGQTDIVITAIAPLKNEYDDNGYFLGQKTMFWIKYADAKPVFDKYEKQHPNNTLMRAVWNDYFAEKAR